MARKVREYFDAGVTLVWLVDPPSRSLHVYRSPDKVSVATEADVVEGGPVLPEFRLALRELFARADAPAGH